MGSSADEQLGQWAHLRAEVEQLVGERISTRDWHRVVEEHGDSHSDELFVGDAVDTVRRWHHADRAHAQEHAHESQPRPVDVADPRYAGLAEILALEADDDPDVARWRANHLGGQLIDEDAVAQFIADLRRAERAGDRKRPFHYRRGDGRVASFTVAIESPLGELARIADRLVAGYHWLPLDAMTWILTGNPPPVHPIVVRLRVTDRAATSRITLAVDPRVPRGEVAAAYDAARSDLKLFAPLHRSSGRTLRPRTVALAVFVAQRQPTESWKSMQQRWNEAHPEWQFKDERAFSKDARLAWERVVGAAYSPTERQTRQADLRASALLEIPPNTLPTTEDQR